LVVNATNASPINIECAGHHLVNGDKVRITGCVGNTAANGDFVVTAVDSYNFTLNGSTGNGAYTGGGIVMVLVGSGAHGHTLTGLTISATGEPRNIVFRPWFRQ